MTAGSRPGSGIDVVLDVHAVAPPLTGIGHYTLELARRLPGHPEVARVRYAAPGGWVADPEARLSEPKGGRMPRSAPLRTLLRPAHRIYRETRELRQRLRYRRLGDAVFHGTNFEVPAVAGPGIATVHDLSVLRHPRFHPAVRVDVMKRAFTRLRQRADHVVAISEFTRRELVELLDWPDERIHVVGLGVRPGFPPPSREGAATALRRFGLRARGYVLCVASIEPRKNIGGLLEAYQRLPAGVKSRWPLVLAGDAGWNSDAVHRRIRRHEREGWLRYLGYVPDRDLPHLVAEARGFVFPSLYEGFGLPVLEAMACGTPVVTSNRASLPEVADGAALLVDPEDPQALANGILRMLEDNAWRTQATDRGRSVAGSYTWDATVAGTVETYRRAGGGASAPQRPPVPPLPNPRMSSR